MAKKDDNPLIINRPEKLNPVRRGVEWSLTSLGWIIWAVLSRPIFVVILWFIGFEIFYKHMIKLGGLHGLADELSVYLTVIVAIFVVIKGWNLYNRVRFVNKDRRQEVKAVTERDVEEFFKMSPENFHKLQSWSTLEVDFLKDRVMEFRNVNNLPEEAVRIYFKPS